MFDVIIGLRAGRHDDDAVHLPADQKLKDVALEFQVVGRVAEHEVVAVLTRAHFDMIRHLGHERVVDVGDNESQQLCLLHDHRPGDIVRGIAHLMANLNHAFARFLANFGAA